MQICTHPPNANKQAQLSTNQAINAAQLLAAPANRHLLEALAPLARILQQQQQPHQAAEGEAAPHSSDPPPPAAAAAAAAAAVLVGDAYYAAKDALFTAEQHALRYNHFQVHVAHPYKYLLHMAHTLLVGEAGGSTRGGGEGGGGGGASGGTEAQHHQSISISPPPPSTACVSEQQRASAVVRVAITLLHDVLTVTALGVEEAPEMLAAAGLVAALQLVQEASSLHGSGGGFDAAAKSGELAAATGLAPDGVGRLAVRMLQLARALAAAGGGE